jgi:hypothetical protein
MSTSLMRLVLTILTTLVGASTNAGAQSALENMVGQNCERLGVDQCYRDGGNRFISTFLNQIHGVVSPSEWATISRIDAQAVADRNVLRMQALADGSGHRKIEISSGSLFYLQSVAYSAILSTLHGDSEEGFNRYIEQLVMVLVENTQKAKLGQSLGPARTFAQSVGISPDEEKKIMSTDKAKGLTALFFQTQFLFILSHEIGHHVLGHVPRQRVPSADEVRAQERQADLFATRIVLKLGYSLAPMISGMSYFAGIEKWGSDGVEDRTHPPANCRLADVLETARNEHAGNPMRDDLNRQLDTIVIDNPNTPAVIRNLRSANGGCKA